MTQALTRDPVRPATTVRRIYNPVQKDHATFLETSAETGGERTLLEIDLAPGGGNTPHYHRAFSERFEVLEGELEVRVDKAIYTLEPGQSETVPADTLHNFTNATGQRTRFLVELRPGSTGFERALQIGYGLAADGKTDAKSRPKDPLHLAVLLALGASSIPGPFALLTPVFRLLAARARRKGVEAELIRTYCRQGERARKGQDGPYYEAARTPHPNLRNL